MQTIEFYIDDSELELLNEIAQLFKVPLSEIYDRMITEYISDCYGQKYTLGEDLKADRLLQKINASCHEHELNEKKREKILKRTQAKCKNQRRIIRLPVSR